MKTQALYVRFIFLFVITAAKTARTQHKVLRKNVSNHERKRKLLDLIRATAICAFNLHRSLHNGQIILANPAGASPKRPAAAARGLDPSWLIIGDNKG